MDKYVPAATAAQAVAIASPEPQSTQAPPSEGHQAPETKPAPSRWPSHIANAFFYLFLIAAIAAAFFLGGNGGAPRSLGGYSAMVVLTGSMQREIPKGSIVVVRQIDPAQIQVGDDITYIRQDNVSITHRVMEIYEDYEGSGMRGFLMQGIENPIPDSDIVFANNVIGKVMWHNALVGRAVNFLISNWMFAILIGGLLLALSVTLKIYFAPEKTKQRKPKPA
jgi:signal peptidase